MLFSILELYTEDQEGKIVQPSSKSAAVRLCVACVSRYDSPGCERQHLIKVFHQKSARKSSSHTALNISSNSCANALRIDIV
jgi:hypothetical protein